MQKDKIVKFKNGNIKIYMYDTFFYNDIDLYYNHEITMNDLYFNQINGYMYLVDYNTQTVYEYMQLGGQKKHNTIYSLCNVQNPLKELIDGLTEHKKIYLFPLTKKLSKSLLQDMENGY